MEGDVEAVLHVRACGHRREGVYAWWHGVVVGGVAMGSLYTCKTPAAAATTGSSFIEPLAPLCVRVYELE